MPNPSFGVKPNIYLVYMHKISCYYYIAFNLTIVLRSDLIHSTVRYTQTAQKIKHGCQQRSGILGENAKQNNFNHPENNTQQNYR